MSRYPSGGRRIRQTPFEHQRLIRAHLGYKHFDGLERLRLTRFLYARLLLGDERPIVLFDLCTARLAGRQVILPGATTLAQLVVQVRNGWPLACTAS